MDRITLEFESGRRCPVLIGAGSIRELGSLWQPGWEQAAIIGDRRVMGRFGSAVEAALSERGVPVLRLDFAPGERHKNRRTKAALEDELLARGFGRRGGIVALGGGISLDVAGFVAATFMRGVPLLNVPTSLLAQVDAAIGGKTGINTPRGKNLVGAFHQPAGAIVDPDWLPSLPAAEWRNGLAEMVKHGVIADEALFGWIEAHAADLGRPGRLPVAPLRRCLEIKAAIVCADEREAGERALLGFGHTIGHAVERASDYRVAHGLAVALGMVVEGHVAAQRCGFAAASLARLARLWPELGFPPFAELELPPFAELLPCLVVDKKRAAGALRMALPLGLGRMAREGAAATVAVPVEQARRAYQRVTRPGGQR